MLWSEAAEEALVHLWTTATDSAELAEAVNRMNELLSLEPHSQGGSREGLVRVLFVLPLAITFVIDDAQRIVTVTRLWSIAS